MEPRWDSCEKAFKTKGHLTRHIQQVHSGKKTKRSQDMDMPKDNHFIPSMVAFSDNMRTETNEGNKFISYQQKKFV